MRKILIFGAICLALFLAFPAQLFAETVYSGKTDATIDPDRELTAAWRFDDLSGEDSTDHPYGYDYTLDISGAELTTGKVGNGLLFDGNDSAIADLIVSQSPMNFDGITFAAWVYPTDTVPDYAHVVSTQSSSANNFSLLQVGGTNNKWGAYVGDEYALVSSFDVDLNTWQHIAVVYSTEDVTLYKNGVADVLSNSAPTLTYNSEVLTVGRTAYENSEMPYGFTGKIDEVLIYSKSANPEEVELMYENDIWASDGTPTDYCNDENMEWELYGYRGGFPGECDCNARCWDDDGYIFEEYQQNTDDKVEGYPGSCTTTGTCWTNWGLMIDDDCYGNKTDGVCDPEIEAAMTDTMTTWDEFNDYVPGMDLDELSHGGDDVITESDYTSGYEDYCYYDEIYYAQGTTYDDGCYECTCQDDLTFDCVDVYCGGNSSYSTSDELFWDIDSDHEFYDAINYVGENGIFGGYEDGSFGANIAINRAELMKVLVEYAYGTPSSAYGDCFPDVTDEWFAPYVCYAQLAGWVEGYPDGTFQPGNLVNQAESVKMFLESNNAPLNTCTEDLASDVYASDWFCSYYDFVETYDLITPWTDPEGWGFKNYSPSDYITRAEIADLFLRYDLNYLQ